MNAIAGRSLVRFACGRCIVLVGALAALINLAGCTTQPRYADPLASVPYRSTDTESIELRGTVDSPFSDQSLCVVIAKNTRDATRSLTELANKYAVWRTPKMAKEVDPKLFTEKIDQALIPRFKRVVLAADMAEAGRAQCDLIMVFDARVLVANSPGQKHTVQLAGLFVDSDGQLIEKVAGQGTSTVPFPAWSLKFSTARDDAFAEFTRSLDSADKLAAYVAERRTHPASTASAAQPSTPAPVQPESSRQSPGGASAPPPDRWAVIVGIARYQLAAQGVVKDLAFADRDAQDFAKALEKLGWGSDHITLVTNEKATKRAVEKALETWLRRAGPDDQIVLFWSSHGWPDPEDPEKAYFACYDSNPADPSSGLRMDRVRQTLEERKVRNVVIIADTCHSGKVIRSSDPKGISVVPALEAMQRKEQVPKGWVFIASADPDRKAYEDKAWNNGALTHVLLEALGGRADGYKSAGARDGTVTLGELRAYITDRMAEETLNIVGARLLPLFYTTSGDPDIWRLTLGAP